VVVVVPGRAEASRRRHLRDGRIEVALAKVGRCATEDAPGHGTKKKKKKKKKR
jgi:hypothetical protein